MSILASRCNWALLVSLAVVSCGSKNDADSLPDYDGLRKADDTNHPPVIPPAAGTNMDWPKLAPTPGTAINVGVSPAGVPGMDAGSDASVVDTGIIDAKSEPAAPSIDTLLSTYLITSPSSGHPNMGLFMPDPSATVSRVGAFTIRTTSYTSFTFQWFATNANASGYVLQFGAEQYFYFSVPSMRNQYSGTATISSGLYMSSTVCSQLPSNCFQTSMNLYLVTTNLEGGITGGLSPALSIPVAIDCGGCL